MPTTRAGSEKADAKRGKEASQAASKEQSLKRGREASTEPALPAAATSTASTKKNRLDPTAEDEGSAEAEAEGMEQDDVPVSASTNMSRSSSGESSSSAKSGKSGKSGKSAKSDKSGKSGKSGKSKSGNSSKRDKAERAAEKAAKADNADKEGKEGKEGKKVKDVRRQVERLSAGADAEGAATDEGLEDEGLEDKEIEVDSLAPAAADTNPEASAGNDMAKTASSSGGAIKRKALERSTSSFVGDVEEGSVEVKRVKDDEGSAETSTSKADVLPEPASAPSSSAPTGPPPVPLDTKPKKTQTTFSSFSSAASPFARATSSASPFGAIGSSTPAANANAFGGGAASGSASPAPNAFDAGADVKGYKDAFSRGESKRETPASGSALGTPVPVQGEAGNAAPAQTAETASAPALASTAPPKSVFGGFGNYTSAASPFAKPRSVGGGAKKESGGGYDTDSASATPFGGKPKAGGAFSSAASGSASGISGANAFASSSFAKYAEKPNPAAAAAASAGFGDMLSGGAGAGEEEEKVVMEEQKVTTGEEDEDTKYSLRTKLYSMEPDGGWKERGVGVLKLNVRRQDGKGARLVMRADGVLRLILNVSLYAGMSCLEDGKHVRMTVFEEGNRQLITLRTGNPKAAAELAAAIQAQIPLGGSGKADDASGWV